MSPLAARGRGLRRPRKVTPARWVAWNVIRRTFDEGAYTDRALAGELERQELDGRDRAFAQRLAYGTVQRARRLDHVIGVVGKRPLRKIDAPVLHALRLGVYELLETGDGAGDHAAVDQAVELVRGAVGERAVAFANAVLRRAQVDGPAILAALDPADASDLATLLSFPEWMVAGMHGQFGQFGVDALAAQNGPAAGGTVAFRVNALHPDAGRVAALLEPLATLVAEVPAVFAEALPEARVFSGATGGLEGLVEDGLLLPQSLSSQLVGPALDPQPDERVLDMCAAPGGKTMHLAALMQNRGEVLACDLHESRAVSVEALARRCGASIVTARVQDATALRSTEDGLFDRVLLDAPCSGLGVLDRRPDARWKRKEDALAELVELQRALLSNAAELVCPGGVLLYSTCTLLRQENEQLVEWALAEPQLGLEPDRLPASVRDGLVGGGAPDTPAHVARVWPQLHASDGFFMARLRKREGGVA